MVELDFGQVLKFCQNLDESGKLQADLDLQISFSFLRDQPGTLLLCSRLLNLELLGFRSL